MSVEILGKKVILEIPKEKPESNEMQKSAGGLYMPKTIESYDQQGNVKLTTVYLAGKDCENVKNGDKVYYDSRMIAPIELEEKKYLFIDEASILGIQR